MREKNTIFKSVIILIVQLSMILSGCSRDFRTDYYIFADISECEQLISEPNKNITVEEVLKYPLPSAEDYNGYYQNPVSLQHPLSSVEIVPSDSSWTLVISSDKDIIDGYLKRYPKCEELSTFNQR